MESSWILLWQSSRTKEIPSERRERQLDAHPPDWRNEKKNSNLLPLGRHDTHPGVNPRAISFCINVKRMPERESEPRKGHGMAAENTAPNTTWTSMLYQAVMSSTSASPKVLLFNILGSSARDAAPSGLGFDMRSGRTWLKKSTI